MLVHGMYQTPGSLGQCFEVFKLNLQNHFHISFPRCDGQFGDLNRSYFSSLTGGVVNFYGPIKSDILYTLCYRMAGHLGTEEILRSPRISTIN